MNAHEYMRRFMLESGEWGDDEWETNQNSYDFIASIHALDYIHSRLEVIDRSLLPKVGVALREVFAKVKTMLKEMYGWKLANFFKTRTPEDDKKKAVNTFIDREVERGKLSNYWSHIFYDESNDQLLFGVNGLPLDKKYFRGMDEFSFRDLAVCLMRVKDFRREDEMERECKELGFSLSSWRESRMEDIDYALRKQMETASWEDIGKYLIAGKSKDKDTQINGGLVSMYGEILQWDTMRMPFPKQSSLMTRALQHAHHSAPVMATRIGLSQDDLEKLNHVPVLPAEDYDECRKLYRRWGRGDEEEGERVWLLRLAAKHGVRL